MTLGTFNILFKAHRISNNIALKLPHKGKKKVMVIRNVIQLFLEHFVVLTAKSPNNPHPLTNDTISTF